MIAPLYDNRNTIRYFIGAQIDVNGLLEAGRGLDSFSNLLSQDKQNSRHGPSSRDRSSKTSQDALAELCAVLNDSETLVVRGIGGRNRGESGVGGGMTSGASTPSLSGAGSGLASPGHRAPRRYVGMDDPSDRDLWPAQHLGPSGRLPGVFQNVRPHPATFSLPPFPSQPFPHRNQTIQNTQNTQTNR